MKFVPFFALGVLSICSVSRAQNFEVLPTYPTDLDSDDTIIRHILTLKASVDNTAKEQWEALQSLRFHILSTRAGLKQAVEDIEKLRRQVASCSSISVQDETVTDMAPAEEPSVVRVTPPTTTRCIWPSELVNGRCYTTVTDELLTWQAAQEHCMSLGGKLAGHEDLDGLRVKLTDEFGIDASRVRWSMWVGARQYISGWVWEDPTCSPAPVANTTWADNQPHASSVLSGDIVAHCMALDGFKDYTGVAVPCTATRRFVCDTTV